MIHEAFAVPMDGGPLTLGRQPVVMGILNVTPDSFSDGGDFSGVEAAVEQARTLAAEGADIIDLGGESTRPGSDEIGVQDELDRVMPVLDALADMRFGRVISIDTYKALVADQAIQAGAKIINDVHGLQRDPEIADVAAHHGAPVIAMHWDPERDTSLDIIDEIRRWLTKSIQIALDAGVAREQIILDPGFGFAKSFEENYALLNRIDDLHALGFPILVGTSRKRMIGNLLDVAPKDRVFGTVATSVLGYVKGAHIFRVHDVRQNRDALRVSSATLYGPPATGG
ncbi:dihydropteroate synthase [Pelagibacterium luteolum]|uniref:Dihydropteroate synthase n=1 Tax=Pelagibacterium luteolum TaxID=440168 RepID=A0A1G7X590_9HYPH|nr:dihydropteroate synthase [Pelagibacterium luteolum]SDG79369.1 dihydropteroate synthase [Pelagibacterium luteolum]